MDYRALIHPACALSFIACAEQQILKRIRYRMGNDREPIKQRLYRLENSFFLSSSKFQL